MHQFSQAQGQVLRNDEMKPRWILRFDLVLYGVIYILFFLRKRIDIRHVIDNYVDVDTVLLYYTDTYCYYYYITLFFYMTIYIYILYYCNKYYCIVI